jgi:hypothetical protein
VGEIGEVGMNPSFITYQPYFCRLKAEEAEEAEEERKRRKRGSGGRRGRRGRRGKHQSPPVPKCTF